MQILVVVNLMAFGIGVLLLFSMVTPHDRRGAGNRKCGSCPPTGTHKLAPFEKH
jgi:hypothetical protein